MSCILLSVVLGGLKKERYIIAANIIIDSGYRFKILSILSIIIGVKGKIVILAHTLPRVCDKVNIRNNRNRFQKRDKYELLFLFY